MLGKGKHKISISQPNKIQFWSIFSTCLVGLFSLWLGITIQDDINTKNAKETQKLARYQMAEAIYPKFVEYIDTCGYVFYDLIEMANTASLSSNSKENLIGKIGSYYKREQIPFIETMNNSVNYMNDNQYYLGAIFGKDLQERICKNNTSILFGLHLLRRNNAFLFSMMDWQNSEHVQDSIAMELSNSYYVKNTIAFKDEVNKGVFDTYKTLCNDVKNLKGDSSAIVNHAIYQFIYLPYIDNFNIFSQELVPSEDVTSHMWKHIILLVGCIVLGLLLFVFLLKHVFGGTVFSKVKEEEIMADNENPLK